MECGRLTPLSVDQRTGRIDGFVEAERDRWGGLCRVYSTSCAGLETAAALYHDAIEIGDIEMTCNRAGEMSARDAEMQRSAWPA